VIVDPKLRLRRSVLDLVHQDAQRLTQRLGASDRIRLDQHLTGIRELEQRLARLEEDPPDLEACAVPGEPAEEYPDLDGRPQLAAIQRAMADILAMALACDQTRVFSNFFTYPVSNHLFPGMRDGHHRLTHDEGGDQPQVNEIIKQIITELAYFLGALARVQEGDSTLLDHSLILCTTDVSFGRTHSIADYPIILAGSASGAIQKGVHYHSSTGENASKVLLSIVRAMGLRRERFGAQGGEVDTSLGAIEA
jgi:hypothetical protein